MQLNDDQQVSRIQGKGEDEITNWHIIHSRFHSMSRQRIHWILTAQSQLPKFSPTCSFHVGTNYKTRAPPEFHWSGQPLWEFAAFIVEVVWQLDFLCQSLPAVNEYLSGHKNWVYGNASSRRSCKYSSVNKTSSPSLHFGSDDIISLWIDCYKYLKTRVVKLTEKPGWQTNGRAGRDGTCAPCAPCVPQGCSSVKPDFSSNQLYRKLF